MKKIKLFEEFIEEKKGLWANIHAKRKRGEKPAKKGDKDYPDEKGWKSATESTVAEGTYNNDREIAVYDGEDGLTHIEKRGNGYYGYNDEFDFEAKDKAELEKKLKSWKYKLISGSIDEAVSQDAHYVHIVTGCGQDAAQNFIDDNKIDGRKLADYVKQYKDSKEKYDVRDIIAGTGVGANKSFVKRFIKELK